MKKIKLILNGTAGTPGTGTLNDVLPLPGNSDPAFGGDVNTMFMLKPALANTTDDLVLFVLNSVATPDIGERGGWNYFVFRAVSNKSALYAQSLVLDNTRVGQRSKAKATITITNGGTAADTITVKATTSLGLVVLGTATSAAGTATALATLVAAAINAGGTEFTVTSAADVVAVYSKRGEDTALVGTSLTIVLSGGATITSTNTAFVEITPKVNANITDVGTAVLAYQAGLYHS